MAIVQPPLPGLWRSVAPMPSVAAVAGSMAAADAATGRVAWTRTGYNAVEKNVIGIKGVLHGNLHDMCMDIYIYIYKCIFVYIYI